MDWAGLKRHASLEKSMQDVSTPAMLLNNLLVFKMLRFAKPVANDQVLSQKNGGEHVFHFLFFDSVSFFFLLLLFFCKYNALIQILKNILLVVS